MVGIGGASSTPQAASLRSCLRFGVAPFVVQQPFHIQHRDTVRGQQLSQVALAQEFNSVEESLLVCTTVEKLVGQADLFEGDPWVPAPVGISNGL